MSSARERGVGEKGKRVKGETGMFLSVLPFTRFPYSPVLPLLRFLFRASQLQLRAYSFEIRLVDS